MRIRPLGFWGAATESALRTHRALLEEEQLEEEKKDREQRRRLGDIQIRLGEASLQRIEDERKYQDEMRRVIEGITTREEPEVGPHGEVYDMKRVPKPYDPIVLTKEMVGVAARHGKLGPTQVLEMEKKLKELKDTRVFEAYQAMQAGDNQRAAEILKNVGVSIDPTTLMGYKEKGPFGFEYDVFVARTPDGGHFRMNPKDLINNVAFKGILGLQQAEALFALEDKKVRAAEKKAEGDEALDKARAEYYRRMAERIKNMPIPQPRSDDRDLTRREVFSRFEKIAGLWAPDASGTMRQMPGIFNTADYMKLYDQLVKEGKPQYEAMSEVAAKMERHQRSLIGTVKEMMEELKKVPESRRAARLAIMIEDATKKGVKREDILRTIEYLGSGMGPYFGVSIIPVSPIGLEAAAERIASSGGDADQFASEMGLTYDLNPAWGKRTAPVVTEQTRGASPQGRTGNWNNPLNLKIEKKTNVD